MSARLSPKQVEALRVLSERSGSAERLGLRMNTLYCLLRQRMATERANGLGVLGTVSRGSEWSITPAGRAALAEKEGKK